MAEKTEELIAEARAYMASNQNQHGRGGLVDQLADALETAEARLAALTTPQEGDARSPWTRHGHLLPGRTPDENRPPMARCGGPKICRQCSAEAGNVHAHESARATNAGQPIREALAECLFIANTRRDGVGPSDEQWRQYHGGKAFGYRRMADAILAAFPVLSRAAAPEPEWEYARQNRYGMVCEPDDSREQAEYRASLGGGYDTVVRRRPAGPWLPVGGEN